jgi:serine/threonine protein kinase
MPLADGTKIAGYRIQRLLGSGGMGEVYLAQHPRLPREDALKVLRADFSAHPDFVERFNREADLVSKLWHPHIVGIHDRGKYRARLWISMDFVDGTDVGRMLEQRYLAGLPAPDAIEIVKAVAAALDYAHARGLLHRDVKPANILVTEIENGERRILLSDFGVARDLADDTSGGLTATNMTVGTAAYAAPEQLMGLPVDGRTDQYSLAATAYHLLAGAPLFQHSNPAVVIGQHLNSTPPALAGVHPELASLDAAFSQALAKSPEDRFASCTEFARALEELAARPARQPTPSLNDADTMLRMATVPTIVAREDDTSDSSALLIQPSGSGRQRMWFAVAVLCFLAAGLLAYFALQDSGKPAAAQAITLAVLTQARTIPANLM